jgi:acid phosphatase (class A)
MAEGARSRRVRQQILIALPCILLAAGCVAATSAEDRPLQRHPAGLTGALASIGRPTPYLTGSDLPDGLRLVPPPPKAGSAAHARDLDGAQRAVSARGGARWALATSDAELFTPTATAALSCAAGRQIDAEATPATFRLLTRAAIDFSSSTASAKEHYKRPRPFMENGQPSCTPEAEGHLRHDGSYPSGHSGIGYGWVSFSQSLSRTGRPLSLPAAGRSVTAGASATCIG